MNKLKQANLLFDAEAWERIRKKGMPAFRQVFRNAPWKSDQGEELERLPNQCRISPQTTLGPGSGTSPSIG
jgi:hypothetical protein